LVEENFRFVLDLWVIGSHNGYGIIGMGFGYLEASPDSLPSVGSKLNEPLRARDVLSIPKF
jgi:hypothetical protein